MAIHLEANYSKKLGLPGYSSHQYSVTLKTEISDLMQVEAESNRLYDLLQSCVDREIQKTGFLPESVGNGTSNGNGQTALRRPAAGISTGAGATAWACTPKQKELILKIVEEQGLHKSQVEALAKARFDKTVSALTKPEASQLIDELINSAGNSTNADNTGPPLPIGNNQSRQPRRLSCGWRVPL